ncbi:MAG TPA: ACT domain-containing protein [Jatrophihabitantaceae bacterium]|nr:ACT domain-containing protein [Jatrophihabitantaceae bacterium]
MSYLLRLVLPDRPGVLGAVATALGGVGADILSVDVIERSPGFAVDDLVVELPTDKLADSLVTAAATIAGVTVESIRPYAGQIDPHRELELLEKLAAQPADTFPLLAEGAARIFRAGWALVLGRPVDGISDVSAASAAAPELSTLPAPWWPAVPARTLDVEQAWVPRDWAAVGTELAVTPLGGRALLLGRPALRWLPGELIRLNHLAGIAASVRTAAGLPD